jgi:diguanylate cyclase (GGDEF)-like protein
VKENVSNYVHGIPGLLVPKEGADYSQLHTDINRFIDTVPGFIDSLEESFANLDKRREYFIKYMELLILHLKDVHARGLEARAESLLRCLQQENGMSLVSKLLKPFIANTLSLSVDMQKAQNFGNENVNAADSFTDIANNLSAVSVLIDDGEYEKAQSMIVDMEGSAPETMMFKLLDLITSQNYGEAENLAAVLKEQHLEEMNQLAGTDMSKVILAVDDRPEILSFVNGALRDHYKVIAVPGGNAALKVLETQNPDLFLLDIDMPEMDGYELASIIRGKAEHKETPLIFLTGNSSRAHIDKAMEVGGNDFLVKPVSHDILLTKVGKFLNKVGLVEQYQRMLERYERDELTGLYGSNKFRDFIDGIEKRTDSIGVIFFDVNGLKEINDTQGHQAGDMLIQKAANSLKIANTGNSYAFRTGGDEFVVIMINCKESDIDELLCKWQNELKRLNEKDDGIDCIVAAGASFASGQYKMSDVMELADQRMYTEKRKMKGE